MDKNDIEYYLPRPKRRDNYNPTGYMRTVRWTYYTATADTTAAGSARSWRDTNATAVGY